MTMSPIAMKALWPVGAEPSGCNRAEMLREIRTRIGETATLADGFFRPWLELRQIGGDYYLLAGPAGKGRNLTDGLDLGLNERFVLAERLARTAAAFEARGVRLGRVRPDNLIREADRFYLEDPILAEMLSPFQNRPRGLSPLLFLAPEMLRGGSDTAAGDRFALGVTLYWLFTARPPFDGSDERQITGRTLSQQPVDPRYYLPFLSESAAKAIVALLHKRVEERPSPEEVRESLAADDASRRLSQRVWCRKREHTPMLRRPDEARRHWGLTAAAAGLLLGLGGLCLLLNRPPAPPPPLAEAKSIAVEFYQARNEGDPEALLTASTSNAAKTSAGGASWLTVNGLTVHPGGDPYHARVVSELSEVSLARGEVKHWTGREILNLEADGGHWRIRGVSRGSPPN